MVTGSHKRPSSRARHRASWAPASSPPCALERGGGAKMNPLPATAQRATSFVDDGWQSLSEFQAAHGGFHRNTKPLLPATSPPDISLRPLDQSLPRCEHGCVLLLCAPHTPTWGFAGLDLKASFHQAERGGAPPENFPSTHTPSTIHSAPTPIPISRLSAITGSRAASSKFSRNQPSLWEL